MVDREERRRKQSDAARRMEPGSRFVCGHVSESCRVQPQGKKWEDEQPRKSHAPFSGSREKGRGNEREL